MAAIETRLRALLETGVAITSELSLEAVLQRIVEAAADLTDARYAALGVIDRAGSGLERFLTTGIGPELRADIGEEPHGKGILGVLIRDAVPMRLHDLTEDPRSVGFPPNHPPMRTFLGVPIVLRGVSYGNLYLTEKAGGEDFTDDDQEIVTLLASQAAVAIENARLYEAAIGWSRQLESLNEVGNALATETELDRLLDLVTRRLRELLGARLVTVVLPAGPDRLRFAAVAGEGGDRLVGQTIARSASKSGRVLARGRSERVDSVLDDPDVDREATRLIGARSGLYVPLIVRGHAIGVLAAHDKVGDDARFSETDLRLAETFATRAALAVDLSERLARDALQRVVEAQELERLADSYAEQTGLTVEFEAALPEARLPAEVETALYRIVQECLTNVVKHARASRVSILVTRTDYAVKVVVEDDGTGFDRSVGRPDGFGLVGMRERLALLGGRLEVESGDGGTAVAAEVPTG